MKRIIGPGGHVEFLIRTKIRNSVEDHPVTIPAKFGSNPPSGFRGEDRNVKSLQRRQTTDAK